MLNVQFTMGSVQWTVYNGLYNCAVYVLRGVGIDGPDLKIREFTATYRQLENNPGMDTPL